MGGTINARPIGYGTNFKSLDRVGIDFGKLGKHTRTNTIGL